MMNDEQTLEEKRKAAIEWMGERWVLHPKHSPEKGKYTSTGMREQPNAS